MYKEATSFICTFNYWCTYWELNLENKESRKNSWTKESKFTIKSDMLVDTYKTLKNQYGNEALFFSMKAYCCFLS